MARLRRTRLVGLDDASTPGPHEKVYEYLPAGSYTFQLWGRVAPATPPAGVPAEWLISLADQALYSAKRLGRNRVVVAGREAEAASPEGSPRSPS